jgi:hypothetical protein
VKLLMLAVTIAACAASAGAADAAWMRRVQDLEALGEAREARRQVDQALRAAPHEAATVEFAAHFADAYREARARALYAQLCALPDLAVPRREAALRRLVELDLLAGDRAAAQAHLAALQQAGAKVNAWPDAAPPLFPMGTIEVPGPIRGFQRMAALAPDLPPEEILTALARNVVTGGYQAISGSEALDQTEYLKLVLRYLAQARELDQFAGRDKVIRITACESERTGELLKILGVRIRGACGGDVALETVNASRAFLTMDSGFPLARLEQALRTDRPFEYDYAPARLPVVFGAGYWLAGREKQAGDFIDAFLNDPSMCRLYLGLVKLDAEPAGQVRAHMPYTRLRAFAHVFDFFGGMLRLRNGVVDVAGGARAAAAWTELAGVAPAQGVAFIERIITRDDGWLASYYDSLGRANPDVLDYMLAHGRLTRYYAALRGKLTAPARRARSSVPTPT